jgi:hypothetical protein
LLEAIAATTWAKFKLSGASARPDDKDIPREAEVRSFLCERLPRRFGVAHGHVIHTDRVRPNSMAVRWSASAVALDPTCRLYLSPRPDVAMPK